MLARATGCESIFADDRAHVVEKSKNQKTGDQEESEEYINIEEGRLMAMVMIN